MSRVEGQEVGIALPSKRVEQGAVPAENDEEVRVRCGDGGEGGVGVLEEVLEAFVPAVHLGGGLARGDGVGRVSEVHEGMVAGEGVVERLVSKKCSFLVQNSRSDRVE